MQIFVSTPTGRTISLNVLRSNEIGEIKRMLRDVEGSASDQQRLIFSGREVDERRTFADLNVQKQSTVHLMYALRGGRDKDLDEENAWGDFSGSDSLPRNLELETFPGNLHAQLLDEAQQQNVSFQTNHTHLNTAGHVLEYSQSNFKCEMLSEGEKAVEEFTMPPVTTELHLPAHSAPVKLGRKGLCYDVSKVEDERLRNRLIRNRESAQRSRKRKLGEVREAEECLAARDAQHRHLCEENLRLRQHLEEIETALANARAMVLTSDTMDLC